MQSLLGDADVSTTMINTHVLKVGGGAVAASLPWPGRLDQVRQDRARYRAVLA